MSMFASASEVEIGDFIGVEFKKPIEVISTEVSPENPGWVSITTVSETGETTESLYSNEVVVFIKNRSPFKL